MAKKYVEIFSSPVTLEDMYYAYECCRKNKKNKYGTKKFEVNALFNVQRIVEDIYYSIMGNQRIKRLYASKFHNSEEAYKSISSRKGEFTHYHGRHLAKRWYEHLPEEIKAEVKMNSDCSVVVIKKKEDGGNKVFQKN